MNKKNKAHDQPKWICLQRKQNFCLDHYVEPRFIRILMNYEKKRCFFVDIYEQIIRYDVGKQASILVRTTVTSSYTF